MPTPGPNCLTTFKIELTYHFNGLTAQPLEHITAPSGEEQHRGANLPVNVNSWGRLAYYPSRHFYPLSDGPSTWHRRITKADFPPCSTGGSCSEAPFQSDTTSR